MTSFWSTFVIVLAVGNILAMLWLLFATSRNKQGDEKTTTGHSWDGIEELNNPLPRWWLWLFVITIVFSCIYLYLYPGLGSFSGSLGWTQTKQYETALAENRAKQTAFFAKFVDTEIPVLAQDADAMRTGARLFANNCATCHGSDGGGAKGFPNLTDDDWLYGGSPDVILTTLENGRAGVMPSLNLSESHISVLTEYVKYLAGDEVTDFVKETGKQRFMVCAACHGMDGKGNQMLGAPNLTDNIWLHGSSNVEISAILREGKQGNMPGFAALLSDDERKLLTAYVISLSAKGEANGE